jgi:hypothetical protein
MFRQLYQIFSLTFQRFCSYQKFVIILLLFALCTSCASSQSSDVILNFNVKPTNRPGVYQAMGQTNLPDGSQIAVAALRYLRPEDGQFLDTNTNTTYSILDREITKVAKGQWQTTLNLWQVASDGRLQESWQLNQTESGFSPNPLPQVSFVATFDPLEQYSALQQQGIAPQELSGSLVRFTNEGQPYVQARQTLPIALPTGKTTPPRLQPEDINGGWGKRYEIKPQPPAPKTMNPLPLKGEQINTPLSRSEFLR